jgi:hypothetical protein
MAKPEYLELIVNINGKQFCYRHLRSEFNHPHIMPPEMLLEDCKRDFASMLAKDLMKEIVVRYEGVEDG